MFNKKLIKKLEERIETLEANIQLVCSHEYDYEYTHFSALSKPNLVWVKCFKCGCEKSIDRSTVPMLLHDQKKKEMEDIAELMNK